MAHTIGRSIVENREVTPGVTDFAPADDGGFRFVILRFTNVSLSGGDTLTVDLGYDTDVFTATSGSEAWTRPIDPRIAPFQITLTGSSSVTLREYVVGERTAGTDPARPNVSHADPFLHTSPHQDAEYETTFRCGATFDWVNVRAAPSDPVVRQVANAVCLIIIIHPRDGAGTALVPSSCSGTLIGPDTILTAHHCFREPDGIDWKSASVTFDYETADADGNRPTPDYSPVFHKVTGVIGRSVSVVQVGEWMLLQIQTPTGGLGITPRELRTTPFISLESVFAVHHPHGSPKKYQDGTPSFPLRPGFDYAGGSSGSSIFDTAGRVIGGPLSNGGACTATYTSASTVLNDLASPRPPDSPLDVVLVLDRSGSMRQEAPPEGRTKLREVQSATAMFVRLVREAAGDRLGLVSYSSTATIHESIAGGAVTPGYKDTLVGSGMVPGGAVGGLNAGGSTSIGDGLQKAMATLNAAPPAGTDRVILLLTDGLHNTNPPVESVGLAGTSLGIAGFGHDHELDGPFLRELAGLNDGAFTRTSDGLGLRKLFALRFGNIFESGASLDPEILLRKDQSEAEWQEFPVCDEDTVTLVVVWDDSRNDLDAVLELPDGITLDFTSPDVTSERGDTWWFIRVKRPPDGAGTWRYRVRRAPIHDEFPPGPRSLRVNTLVIPRGGPLLRPAPQRRHLYTGDDLELRVGLFNTDGTAPHGTVAATMAAPDGSLGALAQKAEWKGPIVDGDPVDGFRATLREAVGVSVPPVPTRTVEFELFDDGNQLDGSFERDGFFTNTLRDMTRFEGTYTIQARAQYHCADLMGSREVTWSVYVEPGIDPSTTGVEVLDARPMGDGRTEGVIRVHPRDRFGNPLGPGRGDRFDVAGTLGTEVTGTPTDNHDGSYDVPAAWDSETGVGPDLVITQPDSDPVVVGGRSTGDKGLAVCPAWLCWLLGLTALALLILLIIALL